MNYQQTLEQVKQFVQSYFDTHQDERLKYHNLEHTKSVVAATMQIANHYQLSDEDFFAVTAAAWFHDTGYGVDLKQHENKSIQIANDFFKGLSIPADVLAKIEECIWATKMPQQPQSLLQNIICDADLYHLGTNDFRKKSKRMHQEVQSLTNNQVTKAEWRSKNIQLLENHQYFTDYCKLLLNEKQQENLAELKKKEQDEQQPERAAMASDSANEGVRSGSVASGEPNKVKKGKTQPFGKGVETMFRITSGNQQRLSNMADSKAHIMISVNSIIISLLLSLLLRKMDQHHQQVIPAILLLTINLVTIVFSILATRPNLTLGKYSREQLESKDVNLLFFGNFFKMTLEDYTDSMFAMMGDNDFLYKSLIRDQYAQGVVLGRKYQLLRIAYNVFMYGLIVAVIAFVISALV